jgi:hypothetical protein
VTRKNTKPNSGKGKSDIAPANTAQRKSRSVDGTAAIVVGPAAIQVKNSFWQTATKTHGGHLTDQDRRMPDSGASEDCGSADRGRYPDL